MKCAFKKCSLVFLIFVAGLLAACQSSNQINLANTDQRAQKGITSFEECVAAGNTVRRSYPAQCVTSDGRTFIQGRADLSREHEPVGSEVAAEGACKNLCGDGQCQEIVCMAVGCPCAESQESCPQDCK